MSVLGVATPIEDKDDASDISEAVVTTGDQSLNQHPENATYRVTIKLGTDVSQVEVSTQYPARSKTEAERADNGTLEADWFQSKEMLATAKEERNGDHEAIEKLGRNTVTFETRTQTTEHGMVNVRDGFTWSGVFAENNEAVIGPEFAKVLNDGNTFVIEVPHYWKAEDATTERQSIDHTTAQYRWTIGEDESPHAVFNQTAADPAEGDGPPGISPGWIVIGWAILLLQYVAIAIGIVMVLITLLLIGFGLYWLWNATATDESDDIER